MTKNLIAIAAAAIVLQGCATKVPPPGPMEDFNEGIAKTCTPSTLDLAATPASATIAMTNDGWCAVRTKERDGRPYALGLLRDRPAHGNVVVQQLGGETRLEYHPNARFVGSDKFSVMLRSRTAGVADALVNVSVDVARGEGVPAEAQAPAPAPAPAATTTRRPAARTPARSSR